MSDWIVPDWPAPRSVRAIASTRRGPGRSRPPYDAFNLGDRVDDAADAVASNRDALRATLALPAAPRWLRQVHGTVVAEFDNDVASDAPTEADAAHTQRAGTVLTVLTADCLPLLICSDDGAEIAAVHAGWRGLAAGVVESCAARLRSPSRQQLAWLGPAIGPRAYEVGEEVRAAFVDRDAGAADAFVATRPGHWLCDLYALARRRLAAVGIERTYGGDLCTYRDPARFFSHRRDRTTGRMASLIWIDPSASRAGGPGVPA